MDVSKCMELVKKILSQFRSKHCWYGYPETEDMIQIGMLEVMKCVKRYNEKQSEFESYAAPRIWGEFLDQLRQRNGMRPCWKAKDKPIVVQFPDQDMVLCGTGRHDAMPDGRRIPITDIYDLGKLSYKPELKIDLSKISKKSRFIIKALYYNGKTQADLMEYYHLTQGRISQLKKIAFNELRAKLLL